MAPKDNLLLQAARRNRQLLSNGEILQTFLAYRLDDAVAKMALGIAIGDPLTLLHEPANPWDANAIKVFWKDEWIGYIPKDMAALIAAEVPEAKSGLDAVVTGLTTTSLRDAFRLQIAIPIPSASRRLRELGVSSSFAWEFDRTSGSDKLRLVISCSEGAFRELQQLLASSFDVSKCGYSYYPAHDGRHYPWYLSLTDASGKAPQQPDDVEQLIRSHFGVASETTRARERQERLQELEETHEEITRRLEISRAEQQRLQHEVDTSKASLELDFKEQLLQLALAENQTLNNQIAQLSNELESNTLELDFFRQTGGATGSGDFTVTPWSAHGQVTEQQISDRLLLSLRRLAGSERLCPRQCLELVSKDLCPGHLLVLESAWRSADGAGGFEHGDRLFERLWLLATRFRDHKLAGAPDLVAGQQVWGNNGYAARESQTIEANPQARRERTFSYNGKTVVMWQHLRIGVKDSENRTLRIHFCWDSDLSQVVIGHCGRHLHVPGH